MVIKPQEKRTKKEGEKRPKPKTIKKMAIGKYISIITINVSGLNAPTKRYRLLLLLGEGNGNPVQYSCLENPSDGGAWWAALYEFSESQHD